MSVENQQSPLPDSVEFSLSKDLNSEKEKLKDKNANLASIFPSKPNPVFDIFSLVFVNVFLRSNSLYRKCALKFYFCFKGNFLIQYLIIM